MMLSSWMSSAAFLLFCLVITNIPLLYMDSFKNKQIFAGVMISVFTILAAVYHYTIIARPLSHMTVTLQRIMTQHTALIRALDDNTTNGPLVINQQTFDVSKKMQQQLLDEMDVSSIHSEVYTLQARVKDLSLQYVRAQQHRVQDRLMGVTESLGGTIQEPKEPLYGSFQPAPAHPPNSFVVNTVRPDEVTLDEQTELASCVSEDPAAMSANSMHIVDPYKKTPIPGSTPSKQPREPELDSAANSTTNPGFGRVGSTRGVVVNKQQLKPDYDTFVLVRGGRFLGDGYNMSLYMERSKNKNTICYEGRVELPMDLRHIAALNSEEPLDVYWLDIDPAYQERNRLKGKMDDREEMNWIEKKMAYGIEVTPSPSEKDVFVVKFVALKSKPMVLRLKNVKVVTAEQRAQMGPSGEKDKDAVNKCTAFTVKPLPVLIVFLNNEECIAEKVYIKSKEPKHVWNLPTVEYIEIHGVELKSGRRVVERITN